MVSTHEVKYSHTIHYRCEYGVRHSFRRLLYILYRKGRRAEKQIKEKGLLDVKFEGMAGGSRCERTGSRIAGESFKQRIVA